MNKPPHKMSDPRNQRRNSLQDLTSEHDSADDLDDLEIAALVSGELQGDDRAAAIQRLISSPEAAKKYRILSDLHLQVQESTPSWFQQYRVLGAAATVLLGLGVGFMLQSPPNQQRDTTDIVRSQADHTVWPADQATVSSLPIHFQWVSQTGAIQYRVRLLDDQAKDLWHSEWIHGTQDSLSLDSSDGISMQDGRYFWIVEVDGRVPQHELGPYWFVYGDN